MQVVIDNVLTNYQIIGDKDKPFLLILHGWKRSIVEWIPVAEQMSHTYQVVLLDLPGFGQTALPSSDFSIYDYANFVEHFLKKLHIEKTALLGHSFGGRIGIILGAKTKLLTQLFLVDAAGVEKRSATAKIKIVFFKIAKLFLPKTLTEKLRQSLGSTDYKTAGALRTTFLKVINEDLSYLLPKITTTTFIIWGEKDTEVPLWKTKYMKAHIPHTKLRVVWGAGHSPHLEKPRAFIETLQELTGDTYDK